MKYLSYKTTRSGLICLLAILALSCSLPIGAQNDEQKKEKRGESE